MTTFNVTVTERNGWVVTVSETDGTDYAKTHAPSLDLALSMALPYMASVVGCPADRLVRDLLDRAEGPA